MSLQSAFKNFMSNSFESACISSTKASWGGSGYSVELFEDGSYRVLWDNQIGNRYDTPGVILGIPALSNEEWDGEDENLCFCFFENAEFVMRESFSEATQYA